jgi:IPT/TIG domain
VTGLLSYAPPAIDRIYPTTSRTVGTVLRDYMDIYGTNFGVTYPTVVFVLPAPLAPAVATVLVSTQTAITVEIPHGVSGGANSTRVSIEVHTTKRFTRLSQCFEYMPPRIASVSPDGAVGCSVDGCLLTIVGDNFGSPLVLLSPPVVLVNDVPCAVRVFDDTLITCTAPPGSGTRNTVTVRLMSRTAVLNGTAFAYSAPAVSGVHPPVVDQHVIAPLLLIGTNFASTHLAISISETPCTSPVFINSSAVECRDAQFLAIGHASIVVRVNGQVSNAAVANTNTNTNTKYTCDTQWRSVGRGSSVGTATARACPARRTRGALDMKQTRSLRPATGRADERALSRACRPAHARLAPSEATAARVTMRTRALNAVCARTCTTDQELTASSAPRTRGYSCSCSSLASYAAAASRRGCTERCST